MPAIPQPPQQPTTMAFIGPTGSGKSTLINALGGLGQPGKPPKLTVSGSAQSVTKKSCAIETTFANGAPAVLLDTPGLGDSDGQDTQNIADMIGELKKCAGVNAFVVVMNGTSCRIDRHQKDMLLIFSQCFGVDFLKNVIVVVTNWASDDKSKKRRAKTQANDGFNEPMEVRRNREIHAAFQTEFKYPGLLPIFFVDSDPPDDEEGELAKRDQVFDLLRAQAQAMSLYPCVDFKAAKTLIDGKEDEIRALQQAGEEMAAKHAEALAKQHAAHEAAMTKISEEHKAHMERSAQEIKNLQGQIQQVQDDNSRLEREIREARDAADEARRAASEASRESGGGGGDGLLGLLLALGLLGGGQRRSMGPPPPGFGVVYGAPDFM